MGDPSTPSERAVNLAVFSAPIAGGLVMTRLTGDQWNWPAAVFVGVPIGIAAVSGRRRRGKNRDHHHGPHQER